MVRINKESGRGGQRLVTEPPLPGCYADGQTETQPGLFGEKWPEEEVEAGSREEAFEEESGLENRIV